MKRYIALIASMVIALSCMATPSNLACLSLFSREDIRQKGHSIVMIQKDDVRSYSLMAEHDPQLYMQIRDMIEKDRKRATSVIESYESGTMSIQLEIVNNTEKINIFFKKEKDGHLDLYISGSNKAFE